MRTPDEHVLAREGYSKDVLFVAEVRLQQKLAHRPRSSQANGAAYGGTE